MGNEAAIFNDAVLQGAGFVFGAMGMIGGYIAICLLLIVLLVADRKEIFRVFVICVCFPATLLALYSIGVLQTEAQDADEGGQCYTDNAVQLVSKMNIREEPTTDSDKVETASIGDAFYVHDSIQGDTYCWLDVDIGWMANTGSVLSLDEPDIKGTDSYQALMTEALDLLEDEAPDQYVYVLVNVDRISPEVPHWSFFPSGHPQAFLGFTIWKHVLVPMGYELTVHSVDPSLLIATTLVHEACHFDQYKEGRWHDMTCIERERECKKASWELARDVDPRSRLRDVIQRSIVAVAHLYRDCDE